LPEGKDPDDLIRESGREAMAEVLAAARPMVDLLWARETENGVFDTPERRAALEARMREVARPIADESVRRHYLHAFDERVAAFFPKPERPQRGESRGRDRRPGRGGPDRRPQIASPADIPVSDRLTRSSMLAGRSALPLREVVIVGTLMNHPALIVRHLDAFAHVEILNPALDALRAALLEIVADDEEADAEAVRARLSASRHSALIPRIDAHLAASGLWTAMPAAADDDAEKGWMQALTLHHRQRTLHKELKDAEAALAEDTSEANFARLVDIQKQLANVEGMEALIEGFGTSSGRQGRSL
ncbi:MAG: DNA primase, partial [Rhizobiales bacterium]|nr:DNA primase [Hyphomicrobiales bacterium]